MTKPWPPSIARALLIGAVAIVSTSEAMAQSAVPLRALKAFWGAPAHCVATLEALNGRLGQPAPDDLLNAGLQLDAGECVLRDPYQASQFYAQAARHGNAAAARRVAAQFGTGRGVPQSYANAGAWLAGKGATDESIEPWDYSVGLAYTLIASTLEQMHFPQEGWPVDAELKLALDADSRQAGKLWWRFVDDTAAPASALRGPLGAAFDVAAAAARVRMAPANPRYVVAARVTLPIVVRRSADARFIVTEQDLLLH
jgi:hypothetical protein